MSEPPVSNLTTLPLSHVRVLGPGDEPVLFEFLERHLETSLFLVSNAERVGLEDSGQPFSGTYVASFDDGRMKAVAAH